jgi:hypothetical protein
MDNRQAKEILQLFRPGTTDALDPQMAEALQAVQRDPELAKWFEEQCAVYLAVRGKLKQIEVPPDLKRKILLGNIGLQSMAPLLYNPMVWLAAAAAIVVLGIGLWFLGTPGNDNDFSVYRDRQARQVQRGYRMTMASTNLNEIRGFLRAKRWDGDYVLTKGLEKLAGEGCAAISWHQKRVSMICFDAGNNKELYLFVANRSELSNIPKPGQTEFTRIHNFMTASWTAGDRVYILAGSGDAAELQAYLD